MKSVHYLFCFGSRYDSLGAAKNLKMMEGKAMEKRMQWYEKYKGTVLDNFGHDIVLIDIETFDDNSKGYVCRDVQTGKITIYSGYMFRMILHHSGKIK